METSSFQGKNEYTFPISGIEKLKEEVPSIFDLGKSQSIWLLKGEMGSGKSTFVKTLCEHLGIIGETSSPSFSIVNDYELKDGKLVHHFDLYRLQSVDELYEIGMEDYLYSGNICLIEWPEMAIDFLPTSYNTLFIERGEQENERIFKLIIHG